MPTVDAAVGAYVKLRDHKKKIQDRHKEELAPINGKMEALENWLLKQLNDQQAQSIKTGSGTVFKHTRTAAKVEDWDATLDFIITNQLWHILERRVSKTAVEELAEENQVVPGVAITRDTVAQIRRG